MVLSRSAIILFITAFCLVDSALGGSLRRKSPAPTLKVLTGTATDACTPQKVKALKARLAEAITLAGDASKALKVEGVETSDSFISFLGDANPEEMYTHHYAPVASLRGVSLVSVTSDEGHTAGEQATAPATETLLKCPSGSSPKCSLPGDPPGRLNSRIASTNQKAQVINLCPSFFEKALIHQPSGEPPRSYEPFPLAAAKPRYLAAKEGDHYWIIPALYLLHEFQHSHSVVGTNVVSDLFVKKDEPNTVVPKPDKPESGVVGVYGSARCIGLPADKKRENAQNIAFFALDVHADPKRGLAQGQETGKKTSKKIKDWFRKSGAEQSAAAGKQATQDTAPKPVTGGGAATDKTEGSSTEQA